MCRISKIWEEIVPFFSVDCVKITVSPKKLGTIYYYPKGGFNHIGAHTDTFQNKQ